LFKLLLKTGHDFYVSNKPPTLNRRFSRSAARHLSIDIGFEPWHVETTMRRYIPNASSVPSLLILLVLWSPNVTPQGTGTTKVTESAAVKEVLEMKRQYDVALMRADSSWFERVFVDDYVLILGDATTYTKSEYIKQLTSRELMWESATGQDQRVRIYGDTAVVTGRFSGKGRLNGKPFTTDERFTSVWIRRNGQWNAVSEHAVCLRPQACMS
jgi:ketosteroid isomerase-like protein